MKTQILIIAFYFFFFSEALGQNIIKYYGEDSTFGYYPSDIIQTSDGGFLIVGHVSLNPSAIESTLQRRFYVRTDSSGDTLWTKYLNHYYYDQSKVIQKSTDDFLIVGTIGGSYSCEYVSSNFPNVEYYFEEISSSGVKLSYSQTGTDVDSFITYCSHSIMGFAKDTSGGLSMFVRFSNLTHSEYLIKEIDVNGNITNTHNIDTSYNLSNTQFELAGNGYWLYSSNRLDKLSSVGSVVWSIPLSMPGFLVDLSAVENDSLLFGVNISGTDECRIIKTDSIGNEAWNNTYPLRVSHIMHHSSGNYLITGRKNSDVKLLAINPDGDSIWSKSYPVNMLGNGIKTIQTLNDGLAILATSGQFGYSYKYVLILEDSLPFSSSLLPAPPTNLNANATLKASSVSKIHLTWTDNSENEDGFIIYQSLNETEGWVAIDSIGMNEESYMDSNLTENTTYYYKVAAYNSSGFSGFSNVASATTFVTGINENLENKQILIYPNPAEEMLYIHSADLMESVKIFDIFGKEVLSKHLQTTETDLNIEHLPAGYYIVKVQMMDRVEVRRVVVGR